jgi:hypothetical protein
VRSESLAWWCSICTIVQQADDVDVLAFAVEQRWIEVSPGAHSVRLLDAGRLISRTDQAVPLDG